MRCWILPAVSLLLTIFFFGEYFSRHVYIPFDLPSFHYPIDDYAFMAIRHGRFPLWDPSTYGGMPLAGSPHAALFYPGVWLMFLANWHRQHLSYWTMEVFVFVHLWMAALLCFAWLRRHLGFFASACGATIYAYSGYGVDQMQHMGVIVGYAWIPFGLMGVDEAAESNSWRPLWKVVAASALGFLGGYTPTWFVMVVCLVSYAICRRSGLKLGLQTCAAIGASLGVAMIQLLPAMQLSSLRVPEARYGLGIRDPAFYLSYLIPNFYDFGPNVSVLKNYGQDYLYLGVPAFVGLMLLLFLRRPAEVSKDASKDGAREGTWSAAPLAGLLAICAVIVTNPFNIVSSIVLRSTLLGQVCRDYYFLAGLTASLAPLAAIGIDRFLKKESLRAPGKFRSAAAFAIVAIGCLAAFAAVSARIWRTSDFAPGWAGAWTVGTLTILFAAGLWLLPRQKGPIGCALAAALLLTAGVDYKVHGTNKRFDGTRDHGWRMDWMPGMNGETFRELQANSVYRISLDQTGPLSADMRHFGLTTPQGFDPFLTTAYSKFIKTTGRFLTNWDLEIDPNNHQGLHALGVGYFISAAQGPQFPALKSNPGLRLLQPDDSFYKVFEVIDKQPPYGVEGSEANVARTRWDPEHRAFTVRTSGAGKFYFSEQWNPGWRARLDGQPVPIERWNDAFQAIALPAGEHRINFDFMDRGLEAGAAVSLFSLLALFAFFRSGFRR